MMIAGGWGHHIFGEPLRRMRKTPRAVAADRLSSVSEREVRELGERWPAALNQSTTRSGRGIVSEMVEFLLQRRKHAGEIAASLRHFLGMTDA